MKNEIITDRNSIEAYRLTQTDEYKEYIESLCKLASYYVSRVRIQFAKKAFENYQNETIRRIVLAYGEELASLEEHRLRDFRFASEYDSGSEDTVEDFCLCKEKSYRETIYMLFDIQF